MLYKKSERLDQCTIELIHGISVVRGQQTTYHCVLDLVGRIRKSRLSKHPKKEGCSNEGFEVEGEHVDVWFGVERYLFLELKIVRKRSRQPTRKNASLPGSLGLSSLGVLDSILFN